jgi:hypothetical protein
MTNYKKILSILGLIVLFIITGCSRVEPNRVLPVERVDSWTWLWNKDVEVIGVHRGWYFDRETRLYVKKNDTIFVILNVPPFVCSGIEVGDRLYMKQPN